MSTNIHRRSRHSKVASGAVLSALMVLVGLLTPLRAEASGNANLELGKTVKTARLTPQLSLSLAVNQSEAVPGDKLAYTATLANAGDALQLSGTLTAQNPTNADATVLSYFDVTSTTSPRHCSAGSAHGHDTSQWTPLAGAAAVETGYSPVLAPPIASGMELTASPVAATGVAYPSSGGRILGTVIDPGSTATWDYLADIALTPAQVNSLLDSKHVTAMRNSFHAEVGPRSQHGEGQPDTVNTEFCQIVSPGVSGDVTQAEIMIHLPGSGSATFDATTTPALGDIAPGAAVQVTAPYTVHVPAAKGASESDQTYLAELGQLNGSTLAASASATAQSYGRAVSASSTGVDTTEQVPIVTISKTGPTSVAAGDHVAYTIALENTGGAPAGSLAVEDLLPDGSALAVGGAPTSLAAQVSGSATASYTVPDSQPAGPLTDTAQVSWQDANGNAYGPVSSTFTTQVTSSFVGSVLKLSPSVAGPNVTGTTQRLTVSFSNANGQPLGDQAVRLTITGANPSVTTLNTATDGSATFAYTGANAGTDTAQAEFTSGSLSLQSNTATISWVTPVVPVSTTSVSGQFYVGGCGYFCGNVNEPLWQQQFPTIDFNPPGGTIPGNNTGVNPNTRPFTDVTTDVSGNFAGTEVAQGNGYQAGVGQLYGFDATFTGTLLVTAAGDQTFDFYDDDGFIFGAGGGATRVSGADLNPPAATELMAYPVMGAYNDPTSPVGNQITVDFPHAGSYPYEVDYSECCGGTLALTMTTSSNGHGVPPAGNLSLTPETVPTQTVGQPIELTVSATDASGQPLADLPIVLNVAGPDSQVLSGTTNQQGVAVIPYVGQSPGTDGLVANADVGGMTAVSNVISVSWAYGSGASSTSPPPTISSPSPADGSVVTSPVPISATITPPAGQSISSWAVTYQELDPGPVVTLASGTGTPPSPLATFDPTLLPNGTYAITVSATASGGGTQSETTTVAVQGNLKLGRYVATFNDLVVPVGGLQIAVQRIYDSTKKATSGDFGFGWRVALSDFRVTANGSLGQGGWTEYPTQCVLGLCEYAYKSSIPHYVTVTWPTGRQEVFDFTPQAGVAVFYTQGTTAFTARAGTNTTSTLQVVGDTTANYQFDGNLYNGSGQVVDPTEYLLTTPSGVKYVLSIQAGLVSESDPNGDTITVSTSGVQSTLGPTSSSSPGPSISFTRDSEGRITEITGPSGQVLKYSYSSSGDLVASTDARGDVTTYAYDSSHDLLSVTGPTSSAPVTQMHYGSSGRLVSITNAEGQTTQVTNNVGQRTQTVVDPNGSLTTVYSYDSLGDLVLEDQVADGQDLVTSWTYDTLGQVLSRTNPDGDTIHAAYNPAGQVTSVTNADGQTTSYAYNSLDEVTSVIGPRGVPLASLAYDSAGNLTSVTEGAQATSTWSYAYTAGGLLASATDPAGATAQLSYDSNGNLASAAVPGGATTAYSVNASGQVQSTTNPDGVKTSFTYDGNGDLTSVTDGNGHTTSYAYDGNGDLTSVTNPLGQVTRYTYNSGSQLTSVENGDGQSIAYTYDVDGNLTSISAPGETLTYTYDPFSRLTAASDPTEALAFTYNGDGQITKATTAGTATASFPATSLAYTYDPAGNITSASGPGGTVSYSYDALSQLTGIQDPAGGKFTLAYNALSELSSLTRPNGVDTSYTYDPTGNLTGISSALGGTTLQALTYIYSPDSQVASMAGPSGSASYSYDPAGQLTGSSSPGASTGYTYDPAGNRLSSPLGAASYNSADQVTAVGGATFTSNADGDLTSESSTAGTATYTYNALDQLVKATSPNGLATTFSYDALGRRASVDANGQTTYYAYDGSNLAATYSGSGTLAASFVNSLGPEGQVELSQGGQAYYYLRDALNSVTSVTNTAGATVDSYSYSPFGRVTVTGSLSNPLTYTGQVSDSSTGIYYYNARYYDPALGRFLTVDPVAAANPYPYVGNDPTNFVDPTGATAVGYGELLSEDTVAGEAAATETEAEGADLTGLVEHSLEQQASGGAVDPVAVVGRQADTAVAQDWAGHEVLNLPADQWSIQANDQWVRSVIDRNMNVYAASNPTWENLWDATAGRPTVFARELQQLTDAGYQWQGYSLVPPGG